MNVAFPFLLSGGTRLTSVVSTVLLWSLIGDAAGLRGDEASAEGSVVRVLGYTEPYRSIEMTTAEAGVVGEIFVEEGQQVDKEDALLSLDNRVKEAQLRVAEMQATSEAAIKVAEAERELANEKYEKLVGLKNRGSAQASEVARAAANLKIADGQLEIAKQEKQIAGLRREQIQAEIERRILRSPVNGVVLEINRDVAEPVAANDGGDAVLVKVAQLDSLRLVVHIPVRIAHSLKVGDDVRVQLLVSGGREGVPAEAVGVIEFISPAADPASETIRTRLIINNTDSRYRSGSHAYVVFPEPADEAVQ